jgi:hypothetical protein
MTHDREYFRSRAAEEWRAVSAAISVAAKIAHTELARRYLARGDEQSNVIPLKQEEAPSRAGLDAACQRPMIFLIMSSRGTAQFNELWRAISVPAQGGEELQAGASWPRSARSADLGRA